MDLESVTSERVGDRWVFSDGRNLPVVAGGDGPVEGAPAGDAGGGAPAPAPAAPAAPAAPTDTGGGAAPADAGGEPAGGQPGRDPATGRFAPAGTAEGGGQAEPQFDGLDYERMIAEAEAGRPVTVEQLRKLSAEHKSYREKWGGIAKAFDGYQEAEVSNLVQFVTDLKDPGRLPVAADWMRDVLNSLSPAQQAALDKAAGVAPGTTAAAAVAGEGGPEGEGGEFDPFNPEHIDARINRLVEQRLASKDQQAQVEQATQAIASKARELGYNPEPSDELYGLLLLTAKNRFPTLSPVEALPKAHEHLESTFAERAQKMLERRAADADLPTAAAGGQAPGGQQRPATMEDATRAAKERLTRIFAGQPGV